MNFAEQQRNPGKHLIGFGVVLALHLLLGYALVTGLAQRLVTLVNLATDTRTGSLSTATSGAAAQIKRYQESIDAWDTRLSTYRASLTTQFTAMETALSALKTQASAISSLVGSSSTSSSTGTTTSSSTG